MDTEPDSLVDTSAAVALLLSDHAAHATTFEALASRRLGLAGHAWFETYSVLTRLPGANRPDPRTVTTLLSENFPESRFLSDAAKGQLAGMLADRGISGGSVYDALVAGAATAHDLPLVTRDRRAEEVYRSFGVAVELLG